MNAPEPSSETGPGTHFRSTFAPASETSLNKTSSPKGASTTVRPASRSSSLASNNPFRDGSEVSPTTGKNQVRQSSREYPSPPNSSSPREDFPAYRDQAFSGYQEAPKRRSHDQSRPPAFDQGVDNGGPSRRRGSSLKERYPGDKSNQPLDIIRRDSRKAHRSSHLKKQHIPGADMIDRLDPALGGIAYHHEGPYDATSLARNLEYKSSPVAAVASTNEEALKATPRENIRDAVEKHRPLDGTAFIPPGERDTMGRTYHYEEGTDMMREGTTSDAGYKRWPGKDYDPEDLGGKSEPAFSLDRALKAHTINDDGIEMLDRPHNDAEYHRKERKGLLDQRDPVEIAGGEGRYTDLEHKNYDQAGGASNIGGSHTLDVTADQAKHNTSLHSIAGSLKRGIGSLKHRKPKYDVDDV